VTVPTGRSTWSILALASIPFLIKIGVMAAGATGYALQSLYKLAQLAVPVYWRRTVDRRRGWAILWPVDEPLPDATTVAIAIGVAALLGGTAVFGILVVAPLAEIEIDPRDLRSGFDTRFQLTPARAAVIVLYLLTMNAALEELHFRAWLDRELSARLGTSAGISVSASAFALMHLFIFANMPAATPVILLLVFAALAVAGIAWSLIARRPGGIHAAWLSHGLTDAGLLTWGLCWLGYF
jgi:membrane protease YdiL (CAAX protease family)